MTETKVPPPYVWVYADGGNVVSVCAPAEMTAVMVSNALHRQRPPAAGCYWRCDAVTIDGAASNPARCNSEPDGRLHWLAEQGKFPVPLRMPAPGPVPSDGAVS